MIDGIHDFPLQFFQEVKIEKQTEEKLGMLIKGGLHGQPGNPHDESDEGVFIARINPGGHASRRSQELEVGQRIIEVNGQSLLGATHSEATDALRNSGNTIHLLVCDAWNESAAPSAIQKGLEENLATLPCSEPAVQNGNRTSSSQEEEYNNDQQPPRPNSAQEVGFN